MLAQNPIKSIFHWYWHQGKQKSRLKQPKTEDYADVSHGESLGCSRRLGGHIKYRMSDFKKAMLKLVNELETDGLQAKDFATLELRILKATQDLGKLAMSELAPELLAKNAENQKKLVQNAKK